MDASDAKLAQELLEGLAQSGMAMAIDTSSENGCGEAGAPVAPAATLPEEDNPLETDFFKAMNAFRAARTSGDRDAMARAEEHLREVVRGELAGE